MPHPKTPKNKENSYLESKNNPFSYNFNLDQHRKSLATRMGSQKSSNVRVSANIQSFYDEEFQKIRELDGIESFDLLESLDVE